jgi:plastocyanin/mono/diheme cytochrome c family protein
MLFVMLGVGLAVLFALLGITSVVSGRLGFGLAGICLVVSAFVYILYARGTAISRTGFAALIMILAIGLILPVLSINQQQAQSNTSTQQYYLTLQRGAALYGQYCASCHGFQGQGINGPQLNNNSSVNALADTDLTRIISGGIPGDPSNPAATGLIMPAWLNTYGGPLTENDISYLVAFIRSSDPAYVQKNNLPNVNGFSYVLGTLTNPTQIAQYHQQEQTGSKPTDFVDMTGKSAVALQIVNNPSGTPANWGFSPPDIIVSVGTTVTWTNVSNQIHTVYTRPGTNPPQPFQSSLLAAGTGTYSFTFAQAGDYPYYCSIHPAMLGWVEVK